MSTTDQRGQALVSLCFFVSGFAALIYQTAWTRQFAFVFGTSELAIATVLAAYMGGLAGGAALAARFAPRIRRPVLAYAALELGIAVSALAVPLGIAGAKNLHAAFFSSVGMPPDEGGLGSALFYLVCSTAILLVPTGLMGATLPLLSRHVVRSNSEIGTKIGALYAINTAGAVAGTLLTGFWILPALGLQGTIFLAVASNALVFAAAALLSRWLPPAGDHSPEKTWARPPGRRSWILPMIALSGAVSFSYEVLWARLLGHIFGGSVYAFATMLGTFLTGIAIGSYLAARRARKVETSIRGFAVAQLGTALFSWIAFSLLNNVPEWTRIVSAWTGEALTGDALIAAGVLLPSTLCIGATFPFAIRIFALEPASATAASARVYSWNTVGAILGAIGAGFFLIPAVGFVTTLVVGVGINFLLAVFGIFLLPARRRVLLAVAGAGILALVLVPPSTPWMLLRNLPLTHKPGRGPIVYFEVGRSATVMMREVNASWRLTTNGLPEALILAKGSHPQTLPMGQWLGAAGVLARPQARSAFVVGLGGGTLLEHLPRSLEQVDVVEIEPAVVEANRLTASHRRLDPLSDPRVRVTINDARSALALTAQRYDLIISQPSHPWTVAASNLYTREFFQEARDHLTDDGVLVQWMGLGFVDDELVRTLVATLLDVFPHVRVYQPSGGAILLLASAEPLELEENVALALPRGPEVFPHLGIAVAEDIGAALILDNEGARNFSAGAEINRDDRNLLQSRSPRLMRHTGETLSREAVFADFEPIGEIPADWDPLYLVQRTARLGLRDRAERIARSLRRPETRVAALGLVEYSRRKTGRAIQLLEQAIAMGDDSDATRLTLIRIHHMDGRGPTLGVPELTASLKSPGARALVAAWNAEREGDIERLRNLDSRLSQILPNEPGFGDARRLRALWRVELGGREEALEALELIDTMGPLTGGPSTLALRARAALEAGYVRGALHTLHRLGDSLKAREMYRPFAVEGLAILDSIATVDIPPGNRGQTQLLRTWLETVAEAGKPVDQRSPESARIRR